MNKCYFAILGERDLSNVLRSVLNILDRWHDLGLALGLDVPELTTIKEDESKSRDRMKAMLTAWLQGKGKDPTWQTLCMALRDKLVDRADQAKLIEKQLK